MKIQKLGSLLGYSLVALCALFLFACSDKKDAPQPAPPPAAETEIARIELEFQQGHLHGLKSFHYVPSGGTFALRDYMNSQTLSFVREGEGWSLAPGSLPNLIAFQMNDYGGAGQDAPDYGLIIRFYDASGKLINDAYAGELGRKSYQFISYPSDVTSYDGSALSVNAEDPTGLLRYVYCDTNVWNQSASHSPVGADGQRLYSFLPATEVIGIKGYYQFPTIARMNLNLDLWYAPESKLQDGQISPFYRANAALQRGQRLLHLLVPIEVFGNKNVLDEVLEQMDEEADDRAAAVPELAEWQALPADSRTWTAEQRALDERVRKARTEALRRQPVAWNSLSADKQEVLTRLMRLLGTDSWEALCRDLITYADSPGDEQARKGYF